MGTNCYIFGDENTHEVVLIDTGGNPLLIIQCIEDKGYKPIGIILTHGHPDHTGGTQKVKEHFDIPVMYHPKEQKMIGYDNVKSIQEPDVLEVGSERLHVLDSPGHTQGGIILVSYENKLIFTGDTLFSGSIGRTDFAGGDHSHLMQSIRTKIMRNNKINDDFRIFPGHMDASTVGKEKRTNMFRRDFM
ncbi:MAG: MBL fold metallo-hydrolase [Candidatus Lokiarchaeota archaeon]|nr:MBL fold metallo-hydrolase [Candidatus Lokiarchaeota archaeon]